MCKHDLVVHNFTKGESELLFFIWCYFCIIIFFSDSTPFGNQATSDDCAVFPLCYVVHELQNLIKTGKLIVFLRV